MRHVGALGQDGAVTQVPAPAVAPPGTKEIPFDHVATFLLEGRRSRRVQDVVNVSIEGAFVAVSIGYSFVPAELSEVEVELRSRRLTMPTPTHPLVQDLLGIAAAVGESPVGLARCLLLRLCGIEFRYSIVDSATGRELQNRAIHSVAGLGEANGKRPFRPLAKPMLFMPRSTIRIEVEEQSDGPLYRGELFIVLHGYKILGWTP